MIIGQGAALPRPSRPFKGTLARAAIGYAFAPRAAFWLSGGFENCRLLPQQPLSQQPLFQSNP